MPTGTPGSLSNITNINNIESLDLVDLITSITTIDTLTSITQLQPIEQGYSFNTAELANTDIFATDITPTNTPTTFRVYVWTDTAGVLSCMRTSGGVTVTENLNQGANLVADSAYEFNITVGAADTINFQLDAAATMTVIVVEVYQ